MPIQVLVRAHVRAHLRTTATVALLIAVAIPIAHRALAASDAPAASRRVAVAATTSTTFGGAPRPAAVPVPTTRARDRRAVSTTTATTVARTTSTTAPHPVTTTTAAPADEVVAAATPLPARPGMATLGRIRIPRIGLDQPLYEGIAQYVIDAGPAHWPGTALPGQPGNMVIAGHRTSYTHPFYAVADLRKGDSIVIDTNDGRHLTYRVDEEFVVPKNALWIKDPLAGRRLTIFTCNPIGSSRERLVVRATYVG